MTLLSFFTLTINLPDFVSQIYSCPKIFFQGSGPLVYFSYSRGYYGGFLRVPFSPVLKRFSGVKTPPVFFTGGGKTGVKNPPVFLRGGVPPPPPVKKKNGGGGVTPPFKKPPPRGLKKPPPG
jgi:hypothetical protein